MSIVCSVLKYLFAVYHFKVLGGKYSVAHDENLPSFTMNVKAQDTVMKHDKKNNINRVTSGSVSRIKRNRIDLIFSGSTINTVVIGIRFTVMTYYRVKYSFSTDEH